MKSLTNGKHHSQVGVAQCHLRLIRTQSLRQRKFPYRLVSNGRLARREPDRHVEQPFTTTTVRGGVLAASSSSRLSAESGHTHLV